MRETGVPLEPSLDDDDDDSCLGRDDDNVPLRRARERLTRSRVSEGECVRRCAATELWWRKQRVQPGTGQVSGFAPLWII